MVPSEPSKRVMQTKFQAQKISKSKSISLSLPVDPSMRWKKNVLDFITTSNKLYLVQDAKEFNKFSPVELYEEAVINCFQVWFSRFASSILICDSIAQIVDSLFFFAISRSRTRGRYEEEFIYSARET